MKKPRLLSLDTGVLLLAVLLQVLFLRLTSLLTTAVICGFLVLLSLLVSRRRRGIVIVFISIAILTVPVLLIRVLTGDTWQSEATAWLVYYLRLVSAALTARIFLLVRGTAGIQRGFVGLVSFLPGRLPSIIGTLVGSSLFLVPVVLVHLGRTFQISRIRYNQSEEGKLRLLSRTLGVTLTSLAALPTQRAEGMVIRGLVE